MKRLSFLLVLMLSCSTAFGQATVDGLIAQLGKPDSDRVRDELVRRGEAAVPALTKLLQDSKADTLARLEAALAMGKIGGEKVVKPLRSVLDDRHVGFAAIIALADVGKPAKAAVADLAQIAGSDDEFLANRAVKAIGQIGYGSDEAIEVLKVCMGKKGDHVVGEAGLALTKLGGPGAEALIKLAVAYSDDSRPESERQYGHAYSLLAWGYVPLDKDLIPLFEKHVRDGGKKAYISMRALASIGRPAKEAVVKLLDDKNADVRLHAADALSWMNAHAQSARQFQGKKVEDPVEADEVYPTLVKLYGHDGGKRNGRIVDIMFRLDSAKAIKTLVELKRERKSESKQEE